jgi:hypothetical protein
MSGRRFFFLISRDGPYSILLLAGCYPPHRHSLEATTVLALRMTNTRPPQSPIDPPQPMPIRHMWRMRMGKICRKINDVAVWRIEPPLLQRKGIGPAPNAMVRSTAKSRERW